MQMMDLRMMKIKEMYNTLPSYIESSCLFLGMAGTGNSKTLLESQRILTTRRSI